MTDQHDTEVIYTKLKLIDVFYQLWPFVKSFPWLLLGAVALTLIHILSARLLPATIGKVIDDGILQSNLSAFLQLAIFYSVLQLTFVISQFGYSYLFAKLGNRALHDLRYKLLQHLQQLPLTFFNKNPTGRLVNRMIYDTSQLQEIFTDGLINLIIQVFVLISIIIAMLIISWQATLICLISIPIFIYISIQITRRLRIYQRESKKQLGQLAAFATERLQAIKVLQVLNLQNRTFDWFKKLSINYQNTSLKMFAQGAKLHPIINLATAITLASLLVISGYLTEQMGLTLGAVTTLILHAQDFIPPLREILERYQMFQNSVTSAERVFPLLTECTENQQIQSYLNLPDVTKTNRLSEFNQINRSEPLDQMNSPMITNGFIFIRNLWFRYSPELDWILKDVSITIASGEKVALVGKTGSGKTTLISLLQCFYLPTHGQIQIDQYLLQEYPMQHIRQSIGVIQQDPFIFRGTLRENICLGNTQFTDSNIFKCLKEIGVHWYFLEKKMDLDFWIEERGQNLSLGEKQLINLIRLFLFNPKIFIMDEATANLDSQTEQLIQTTLERLVQNRTLIIIAHRLSTLKLCDRILLLSDGQIQTTSLAFVVQNPHILL